MKKLLILLIAFLTFITLPGLHTQAFDIPLNYGETDNDEPFVQTKNLFDITDTLTAGLNSYTTTSFNSGTLSIVNNEITITDDPSTASGFFMVIATSQNTNYAVSFNETDGQVGVYGDDTTTQLQALTSSNFTFNSGLNDSISLTFYSGLSYTTSTFENIQLELGSTDTSYSPYGFLSLNDIFVDGQLLTNGDFNDGITGWTAVGGAITETNGIATLTTTATANAHLRQTILNLTDTFYFRSRLRTLSNNINSLDIGNFSSYITQTTPINSQWYELKGIRLGSSFGNNIFYLTLSEPATAGLIMEVDYAYALNLNLLGIDHLTQLQLDSLFDDWQTNNIYDQGFTDGEQSTTAYASGFNDGYTSGYNTGYSDAVQEDNAYSLGYALGLSEGQDMETGSSIIILVLAALSFGFMIFGFSSRKRIFNLFAAGLFIALGGLMVEYPAFIVISIGFVIFNIWYTFGSD